MRSVLKWAVLLVLIGLAPAGCELMSPALSARFEVTPLVLYAGEAGQFDASDSVGGTIVAYAWTFGDGGEAAGREATHAFGQPGRYRVTLRVSDDVGTQATTAREVTVYARSGTELFREDFSTGSTALSRWALDPSWASEGEGFIENLAGPHGFVLHVRSGTDRWHRRTTPVRLPPLRIGQRLVFSCALRTAENQDAHAFFLVPARVELDSVQGSLPYFVFSSQEGGAQVRVPEGDGEARVFVPFKPAVYLWHTYRFVYAAARWELYIDDVLMGQGELRVPVEEGGDRLVLLGDESHAEAVDACYDDLRMWIEE